MAGKSSPCFALGLWTNLKPSFSRRPSITGRRSRWRGEQRDRRHSGSLCSLSSLRSKEFGKILFLPTAVFLKKNLVFRTAQPALEQDPHWRPITELCSVCEIRLSHIIHMEHLKSEQEWLFKVSFILISYVFKRQRNYLPIYII